MITERTILVCAAVAAELDGLIARLKSPLRQRIGGRTMITGRIGNLPVSLLITGPAMVNTAQALTAVLETNPPPACVIQTGCAGAFRQSGLDIGDIAVASCVIDAELGIEAPENDPRLTQPLPFPVLIRNANEIRQEYPVTQTLAQSALSILRRHYADSAIRVQSGSIISVSTITAGEKRAKRLYAQFAACMEAMEGAAAAHVALYYHVPFIEIRAASNRVGTRDRDNWNPELAFQRCCDAVALFISDLEITDNV